MFLKKIAKLSKRQKLIAFLNLLLIPIYYLIFYRQDPFLGYYSWQGSVVAVVVIVLAGFLDYKVLRNKCSNQVRYLISNSYYIPFCYIYNTWQPDTTAKFNFICFIIVCMYSFLLSLLDRNEGFAILKPRNPYK